MKKFGLYLICLIVGIILYYLVNTLCNCLQSGNSFNVGGVGVPLNGSCTSTEECDGSLVCEDNICVSKAGAAGGGGYQLVEQSEMGDLLPSADGNASDGGKVAGGGGSGIEGDVSKYDAYILSILLEGTSHNIGGTYAFQDQRIPYSDILETYNSRHNTGYIHSPESIEESQYFLLLHDFGFGTGAEFPGGRPDSTSYQENLRADAIKSRAGEYREKHHLSEAGDPINDILICSKQLKKNIKGCFTNCFGKCIQEDTLWTKVLTDASREELNAFLISTKQNDIHTFMFFNLTEISVGPQGLLSPFIFPEEGDESIREIYIEEIKKIILDIEHQSNEQYLLDLGNILTTMGDNNLRVQILQDIINTSTIKLDDNKNRIISSIIDVDGTFDDV